MFIFKMLTQSIVAELIALVTEQMIILLQVN